MSEFWQPTYLQESASGARELSLMTRHLMNRRVFLEGEINHEMAMRLVSQLLYLDEDAQEPVKLYINSPGGSVNAGLMLYDVLASMKAPVERYCVGMAASMAAVLLAGGSQGTRFILPHSEVMIHEPLLAAGMGGSATSLKRKADSIMETRQMINEMLAKHTGKTVEEIDEATAFDNYMNAEESVAFGLCDEVVTRL